jgi:hypothetical protein
MYTLYMYEMFQMHCLKLLWKVLKKIQIIFLKSMFICNGTTIYLRKFSKCFIKYLYLLIFNHKNSLRKHYKNLCNKCSLEYYVCVMHLLLGDQDWLIYFLKKDKHITRRNILICNLSIILKFILILSSKFLEII